MSVLIVGMHQGIVESFRSVLAKKKVVTNDNYVMNAMEVTAELKINETSCIVIIEKGYALHEDELYNRYQLLRDISVESIHIPIVYCAMKEDPDFDEFVKSRVYRIIYSNKGQINISDLSLAIKDAEAKFQVGLVLEDESDEEQEEYSEEYETDDYDADDEESEDDYDETLEQAEELESEELATEEAEDMSESAGISPESLSQFDSNENPMIRKARQAGLLPAVRYPSKSAETLSLEPEAVREVSSSNIYNSDQVAVEQASVAQRDDIITQVKVDPHMGSRISFLGRLKKMRWPIVASKVSAAETGSAIKPVVSLAQNHPSHNRFFGEELSIPEQSIIAVYNLVPGAGATTMALRLAKFLFEQLHARPLVVAMDGKRDLDYVSNPRIDTIIPEIHLVDTIVPQLIASKEYAYIILDCGTLFNLAPSGTPLQYDVTNKRSLVMEVMRATYRIACTFAAPWHQKKVEYLTSVGLTQNTLLLADQAYECSYAPVYDRAASMNDLMQLLFSSQSSKRSQIKSV